MAFLPTKAFGFDDGDALDPDLVKRLLHLIKLERLDDGLDLLHHSTSPCPQMRLLPGAEHNPCQPPHRQFGPPNRMCPADKSTCRADCLVSRQIQARRVYAASERGRFPRK